MECAKNFWSVVAGSSFGPSSSSCRITCGGGTSAHTGDTSSSGTGRPAHSRASASGSGHGSGASSAGHVTPSVPRS